MSKYWKDREQDALYNAIAKQADKELANQYRRCFNLTLTQLKKLYDEILADTAGGTLLVSDLYRYNRYYELLNNLNHNLTSLGEAEIKIETSSLTKMYADNAEIVGKSVGTTTKIDDALVKQAINRVWCKDGKNWSSRIWTNKSALETRVVDGMVDCIARGVSHKELTKQLMDDFGVGYHNAERISRTELAYVQIASTLDRYKSAGIEKYEIYHAHDARVCIETCENMDGKQFNIKDAQVGINLPPFHPNCRCTILPVIKTEEK